MDFGLGFFIIWIGLSILVGSYANSRGRSYFGYTVLAIITSPLLGFIIVACTRNVAAEREEHHRHEQEQHRTLQALRVLANANSTGTPPSSTSVADELSKLHTLKTQGALSDAEFEALKTKLLRGTP